jgi:uncharacterized protein YjbI with pentapeptide repeats
MESFKKNRWKWTGLSEKTLFDCLEAFAVPIIVAVSAAGATLAIGHQQSQISEDHQRSELMAKYYERMQVLLIDKKMLDTPTDSQERKIGIALTLSTFRQLKDDGVLKGELLKFLYQSKLIGGQCQSSSGSSQSKTCLDIEIELKGARLDGVIFESDENVQLPGVDLESAKLEGANLPEIQLSKAKLNQANLTEAILTGALLEEAEMKNTLLENAKLTNANMYRTILTGANLRGAILTNANLKEADLRCALLQGANLETIKPGELEGSMFQGATYDKLTNFPDGFDAKAQGMKEADVGGVLREKCVASIKLAGSEDLQPS